MNPDFPLASLGDGVTLTLIFGSSHPTGTLKVRWRGCRPPLSSPLSDRSRSSPSLPPSLRARWIDAPARSHRASPARSLAEHTEANKRERQQEDWANLVLQDKTLRLASERTGSGCVSAWPLRHGNDDVHRSGCKGGGGGVCERT